MENSGQACKLLLFDLDDTLWPSRPVLERAEKQTYLWMQEHAPRITDKYSLRDSFARRMELVKSLDIDEHRVSEMRLSAYRLLAREAGYDDRAASAIAERAFEHFLQLRQQVQCFDDVMDALRRLHGLYILGALSNGNANLDRIEAGKYFSFAIAAEDLGYGKPHPQAFMAALRKAGEVRGKEILPAHAVHVGDDLLRDVEGARAAGLRAIWLDRDANRDHRLLEISGTAETKPYHARIGSLKQLEPALVALEKLQPEPGADN